MKIFISYRREDSATTTGRIDDRLVSAFGRNNVYKDVDSVPLGIDFREHVKRAVSQCDVLLAVMGKHWLNADDGSGNRRLDQESDWVRIEIETALDRNIQVIPLLVDGVSVPLPKDLPTRLNALAFRNGIAVRYDPDFHRDMDRLVEALRHGRAGKSIAVKVGDASLVNGKRSRNALFLGVLVLVPAIILIGVMTWDPRKELGNASNDDIKKQILQNQSLQAEAIMNSKHGSRVRGLATFVEEATGGVRIRVRIENGPSGSHGLNIHDFDDCSDEDAIKAGSHFNPGRTPHGGPMDEKRHAGDLGNIDIDSNGNGNMELMSHMLTVQPGPNSVIGRSIILHERPDDPVAQPTGNSGARLACGSILVK